MDATRRGFLKGIGALGAVMAGQFVLRDPQVIEGNLLVPNPEPTILRATKPASKVTAAARGYVQALNIDCDSIYMGVKQDGRKTYRHGLMEINMHLRLTPEPGDDFNALLGNEVEVYVVRKGQ